jgi:hypothetical protein
MSSSRSGTNGARRARPGVCGRRLIGVSLRGARDSVAAGESWTGGGVSPASRSVTCETGARFVRIRLPAVRFLEAVCPDPRCGGGRGSRLICVSFRWGERSWLRCVDSSRVRHLRVVSCRCARDDGSQWETSAGGLPVPGRSRTCKSSGGRRLPVRQVRICRVVVGRSQSVNITNLGRYLKRSDDIYARGPGFRGGAIAFEPSRR